MVTAMQPVAIDWSKCDHVLVTLETPYAPQRGSFRFRYGTNKATKNLAFDARVPGSLPYFPGAPIMYPDDAPAIAGDPDRASWEMPLDAAMQCFGHWHAPLAVAAGGIDGLTQGAERERVAVFWGWYQMPPGDGTMHPPMNKIGPPKVPDVSIRPLDKRHRPIKDAKGDEVVIRVREFYNFDDPMQYDVLPGVIASQVSSGPQPAPADAKALDFLASLGDAELERLRELLKGPKANGKG